MDSFYKCWFAVVNVTEPLHRTHHILDPGFCNQNIGGDAGENVHSAYLQNNHDLIINTCY